ncbi:uncharacterized protein BDW47DRAFT_26072 [Aspergillus candidus]|uniref:Uncharacterized protein n=1 Tax=Aspergillus candidus TaxID=41067 RepID=A0A2I2FNN4_ASPCN|nr:hypothetical protein BDW47DRAFT_26072 [Aspergillus candidus]PLB42235.1 hypothetical protein BDW47DRAFT_26072 [Aspergillus candidus]
MHISGPSVNPFDKGTRRHSYHLSSIFSYLFFLFSSFWYCRLMRCLAFNIPSISLFLSLCLGLRVGISMLLRFCHTQLAIISLSLFAL